jgi:hypothetical protein
VLVDGPGCSFQRSLPGAGGFIHRAGADLVSGLSAALDSITQPQTARDPGRSRLPGADSDSEPGSSDFG